MTKTRTFQLSAFGFLLLIVVIGAGCLLFLRSSANGFSAKADPTAVEVCAARTARSLALPSAATERINPVPKTQGNLEEAMAHWADHCAVCHGNDGAGEVTMGKQMYPHAPDMRRPGTQKLSDGELFYIIENGIRLSGMPAWGGSKVNEQASWKLVQFIRHLPDLTPAEIDGMAKLNPQSPEEVARQQEEEQFLNSQTTDEAPKHNPKEKRK